MSARLYRVILPVSDIDRAATFYGQLFDQSGFRVSPGRHYFHCGGTILACFDARADGDAFDSRSNEDAIETRPWGERSFYARDPFGNPICFVDEKSTFTGPA